MCLFVDGLFVFVRSCTVIYGTVHSCRRVRTGVQCSDAFFGDTSCIIYDAVIQTLTNNSTPRLNCTPQFDLSFDFDGSGSSGGRSYDNHWWEGGEGDAGYSNGGGGGLFGSTEYGVHLRAEEGLSVHVLA